MMVNIAWRRSGHDGQVHAFPLAQVAEPGRSYPEAICSHSAPPSVLEPAGYRPGQNHVDGHWAALLDKKQLPGVPGPRQRPTRGCRPAQHTVTLIPGRPAAFPRSPALGRAPHRTPSIG